MMISPSMKKFYVYITILAIIVLFLFVPLIVPYLSRSADYSVFNDEWNGTSRFYKEYIQLSKTNNIQVNDEQFLNTIIGDVSRSNISDFENSVFICIGPSNGFYDDEKEFLSRFVEEGGIILLADDFGSGNELLEYLGAQQRFSNQLMMDSIYVKSGVFPIMFKGSELSEYNLLLNYPSTISDVSEPLLLSSDMAFLDANNNLSYDKTEIMGPFCVGAVFEYGEGQVYLLSDPSIFINNMIGHLDNEQYIFNLLEKITLNYEKSVYIDESHLGSLQDMKNIDMIIKIPNTMIFKYSMAAFIIVLFIIECQIPSTIKKSIKLIINKFKFYKETDKKEIDRDELILSLKIIHPEWQLQKMNSFFSKFK